ncbi:hypothetical protein Tco_1184979, partial [Tanacetum coccineum]
SGGGFGGCEGGEGDGVAAAVRGVDDDDDGRRDGGGSDEATMVMTSMVRWSWC